MFNEMFCPICHSGVAEATLVRLYEPQPGDRIVCENEHYRHVFTIDGLNILVRLKLQAEDRENLYTALESVN